jgi:hypothetical protein
MRWIGLPVPGGSSLDVQYNNSGVLAGITGFAKGSTASDPVVTSTAQAATSTPLKLVGATSQSANLLTVASNIADQITIDNAGNLSLRDKNELRLYNDADNKYSGFYFDGSADALYKLPAAYPGFATSTVRCGNSNLAGANFATVSGGRLNTANQIFSTVAGGSSNTNSSAYSSISGGFKNRIVSCFGSSIGGGISNTASCYTTFIGAGRCNTVFGNQGVITGGDSNKITNSASGSFIGSGQVNLINGGGKSAILGGSCNTLTNLFSNLLSELP